MRTDEISSVTILPPITHPTKMSTATCASVFEDLESALMFLDSGLQELNPIQRELAGRFTSMCKTFARDMLAAEGDSNALRVIFGLPVNRERC